MGGRTVNVMAWKKDIVGKGNASKDEVAAWLEVHHPDYYEQCHGDQNLVDATCVALYGRLVMDRAEVLVGEE